MCKDFGGKIRRCFCGLNRAEKRAALYYIPVKETCCQIIWRWMRCKRKPKPVPRKFRNSLEKNEFENAIKRRESEFKSKVIWLRTQNSDMFVEIKADDLVINESWIKKAVYLGLSGPAAGGAYWMFINLVQRVAAMLVWQIAKGDNEKILYDSQCNPFGWYMDRSLVLEQLGYPGDLPNVNPLVTPEELYIQSLSEKMFFDVPYARDQQADLQDECDMDCQQSGTVWSLVLIMQMFYALFYAINMTCLFIGV